ncbi:MULTISPECIES: thiamine pyrophosphate-dependent dehydrogenase E1 component subunit alpha [unclassified Novosphingobium]|uniref:thiamine pyrophosphate-dependent dehydrogenase E1 component subunit alpha n=1 Tax=unclassified Novosphingobium TaxID=2644732 RepID=UPI00181F7DC4|nr:MULTISPECIES: thiamine pyrophosphate-dependent dehydrogenase E1 component subunit alpha [unclassified Novosphingobium]MBB3359748.1 pyruvate dehydrogenase E1 component alpha subunit [Novosphingobium sp. BK256]MBB3376107.1 pyruvate dehydrogenase E1 component alpha subunit [Novosphingobium sp. BK280]MBB3380521.1 pyruvate dehydrogenase E1 component alpha subunit [Novosphingobium sp. BK258]MBB3422172.1 pyruvate dehydrogenase E1 component alpha subunit [Novosphingobium sp. BK267]MBB3450972.1 pyru
MSQLSNVDAAKQQEWMALYERMLLVRRAEERLSKEAQAGSLPGGVHLYIGQEASGVGVCSVLEDSDFITSTHRGHGHFLAKGGDLKAMFAELWGKRTGICKGMGGSMHVADVSKGILGANGIVGGGIAIAAGAALGIKVAGEKKVSVCLFGDGAANQGVLMESLNMSAVWSFPVIWVLENNGLSEFTITKKVTAGEFTDRARAVGLPTVTVDGNDVIAVQAAMAEAVERARSGGGSTFIETLTYRIRGHLEAEDAFLGGYSYRTQEEIDVWRAPHRDPILRFAARLVEEGVATPEQLAALDADVLGQIEGAVQYALASEDADPELIFDITFSGQRA